MHEVFVHAKSDTKETEDAARRLLDWSQLWVFTSSVLVGKTCIMCGPNDLNEIKYDVFNFKHRKRILIKIISQYVRTE